MNTNLPKKKKEISALDIAKYFIWKASQENKELTNKKLQKLLYYAQAWNLVFKGEPLFEENIEAWIHGPAIRDVYEKYKHFGYGQISEEIKIEEIEAIPNLDLLEEVWQVYGKFDGDYLENLSHNEDPWQNARGGIDKDVSSNNVISNDSMKEYFSNLISSQTK